MCAMAEQMRWMTESVNMLQSTDEDERRLAEEVEKVSKTMAGMGKQATGGDLQRVAEMEESLKKLEKEVQAKDVDDRKMTRNFAETGEKKVTREGRGCAGLVQGRDESGKGKGKGREGKGEHGKEGGQGGKGARQKMPREEDQEDERTVVAPNTGAGGSHPGPRRIRRRREGRRRRRRGRRAAVRRKKAKPGRRVDAEAGERMAEVGRLCRCGAGGR